jgi:hypothetical protein
LTPAAWCRGDFQRANGSIFFVEWGFSGQGRLNAEEAATLFSILDMGKEAYGVAVYDQLGATAYVWCRVFEVYRSLMLGQHNKALLFRADILNLHSLTVRLEDLLDLVWRIVGWTTTPTLHAP